MFTRLRTLSFRRSRAGSLSGLLTSEDSEDHGASIDQRTLLSEDALDASVAAPAAAAAEEEEHEVEGGGCVDLVREFWRSGAWRVLPIHLLLGVAFAMVSPALPNYCTDYFASKAIGEEEACEKYTGSEEPQWCADAHWQCTQYQAWWMFLNLSVIGFFVAPVFGKLSDRFGRRFFLVLGTIIQFLPIFASYLMSRDTRNFAFSYPLFSLGLSGLGVIAPSLAYISDCSSQRNRTQSMGITYGVLFAGVIIGPMLAKLMNLQQGAVVSCTLGLTAILYALSVPESLHKKEGPPATLGPTALVPRRNRSLNQLLSLGRSRFFVLMAAFACMQAIVFEGSQEISAQYFQLVADFTTSDMQTLLILAASSAMLVNFLALPALMAVLREKHILAVVSFAMVIDHICLGLFAHDKVVAMTFQVLGTLSFLLYGVSTGMISKAVSAKHQGLLIGVMSGLRSQAMGISPVVFSFLFRIFTDSKSSLPFFPGAPYFVSASVLFACGIVALCMDPAATIEIDD